MLKVISRQSPLAQLQVEELFKKVPELDYELNAVQSYGDKHQDISLMDNTQADFFTRELDKALVERQADIAIHSAKDLPYPLHPDLRVISLLPPADQSDALAGKYDLQSLPQRARVGVSSVSRREQLLAARADLKCIDIRGTIEQRLEYIDRGEVEAIIVATCALNRLGLESRIGGVLPFHTHPLQGHLAVTARFDRPELKALFYPLDHRVTYGKVSLLGCGPGHFELMTLKADKLLRQADIIYHDDLLDQGSLDQYPAKKIYVGKRKGAHHKTQGETNELLYQSARSGLTVVRLKGGDPFIFGRGGEELSFLQERMINVEVIPGISSVQAAAATINVPLTQRGVSDQLHILSGHHVHKKEILLEQKGTYAFYMAATRLEELQQQLLEKFEESTPVALIQWASLPYEQTHYTRVEELKDCPLQSPLMVLVGEVAGLAARQSVIWHTGLWPQYTRLPYRLLHYPLIKIEEIPRVHGIDWGKYQGVIFTSQNAVNLFFKYHRIPQGIKVAAIGNVTASCLESHYCTVDILPAQDNSHSLRPLIEQDNDTYYLYPGSDISRNELHDLDNVERLSIYTTRTLKVHPAFKLDRLEGVIFTSPSTIRAFAENFPSFPDHLVYYVRGPLCRKELSNYVVKEANIVLL